MPIINNNHGGSQFEVFTVIRKVLESNQRKPMTEEIIVSWCRPEALALGKSARSKVGQEINAWKDLGLLNEIEGGLTLNEDYFPDSSVLTSTGARRCLLSAENNENLDTRDQRAADLTKLVSMILSLDVYRYPEIRSNNLEEITGSFLSDFRINSNETAILSPYMHWLGFASRIGNSTYAIDPTVAIKEELLATDSPIEQNTQLSIESFLQQLVNLIPVLDGGDYRMHTEQRMNSHNWSKPKDNELSTSLSRALLRLHHSGTIKLQKLSDAGLRNLKGSNNKVLMAVTHVTVLGAK